LTIKQVIYGVLILALVAGAVIFWPNNEITYPPGVLVEEYPVSTPLKEPKTWERDEYKFKALRKVHIKARVLSKEGYWMDRESDLAPYDLALGWGPLSDQAVLDGLEISQRGRWYHWQYKKATTNNREVQLHSSNMHMIPSSDEIEDVLDDIVKGNIIEIDGYLVEIRKADGWHWISSTRWDDTAGGACEVVWIENIKILK
jgi:hypothetical protein